MLYQVQCIYVMLERFQAFTGDKFDMNADIEQTYFAQLGDAAEQVDGLTITRRFASTGETVPFISSNAT